jgi:hypothetical protein
VQYGVVSRLLTLCQQVLSGLPEGGICFVKSLELLGKIIEIAAQSH